MNCPKEYETNEPNEQQAEAIMPNQTRTPGPGDIADERGRFATDALPGDPAIDPAVGSDEAGADGSSGDTPPASRTGTQDEAVESLADPGADANCPDPSRPISV